MTTMLMQLVGPMQAWGFRSRFDNRDTGLEPTRSGIIGLLCAALGWGRDVDLRRFESLKIGVRVEKPGRVALDYHTAQNVWREGKDASTVVSTRYYLADARFLAALESDDVLWLQQLEGALKNPVWPLFLGRKSFVPGLPIHLEQSGLREGGCESVLRAEPWRFFSRREERESQQSPPQLRLVLESEAPKGGVSQGVAKNDVPRDFRRRTYGVRYVRTDFCVPQTREWHPMMLGNAQ